MACCGGSACAGIERQFGERVAARELERYRRRGPRPTTRMLLDGLRRAGPPEGTLLDVGAGIGALTLQLLESGVERAVAIDASPACVEAGRAEATRRGHAGRVEWIQGDFTQRASQLEPATIVALDRVVCCYPDADSLLRECIAHARSRLALSYPRGRWYVRAGVAAENALRRLTRNPFRTFVHPTAAMATLIRAHRFRLASHTGGLVWCADVWVRE